MALDPAVLDELYQLATQYQAPTSFMNMPYTPIGSDPDLEGGGSPFGQIGHASTPFGDQYFGSTSYFGPRLVQTPYGDVFYGSAPLAGTKLGDVAPKIPTPAAVTAPPPAAAAAPVAVAAPAQQLPYWMQMPPGWGELPAAPGGAGGGGSGGSGSGGGDSGR